MKIQKHSLLHRGFTIIELMVSMVITLIIIGMLIFVTRAAFDTLAQGSGNASNKIKAEQALDYLAQDLEGLVYRSGNDFEWLAAKGESVSGGVKGFYSNLAFFTSALDRYNGNVTSGDGDIACVNYGIEFNAVIGTSQSRMVLYRKLVDPDDTFTNLLGSTDLLGDISSVGGALNSPSNLMSDNIRELTVSFVTQYTDSAGNLQLENVSIIKTGATDVEFSFKGNGVPDPSDPDASPIPAKITAITINAQILSEDTNALLNITNNPPVERIEQGITRYSRTIYVPQVD